MRMHMTLMMGMIFFTRKGLFAMLAVSKWIPNQIKFLTSCIFFCTYFVNLASTLLHLLKLVQFTHSCTCPSGCLWHLYDFTVFGWNQGCKSSFIWDLDILLIGEVAKQSWKRTAEEKEDKERTENLISISWTERGVLRKVFQFRLSPANIIDTFPSTEPRKPKSPVNLPAMQISFLEPMTA